MNKTSHNKIYVVLIICISIIASTIILSRRAPLPEKRGGDTLLLENTDYASSLGTTTTVDWVKTLSKINPNLIATTTSAPEEMTLTDRFARDVFARYLDIASADHEVTDEEEASIVNTILSNQEYVNGIRGVIYIEQNLKIIGPSTNVTLAQYSTTVNKIFADGLAKIKSKTPIAQLVNDAVTNQDQKKIAEIGTYVTGTKYVLTSLLATKVPSDLAQLHLKLVNSVSNVLSDLEAMEKAIDDPVRGYIGMTKYPLDTEEAQGVIYQISAYYRSKFQ